MPPAFPKWTESIAVGSKRFVEATKDATNMNFGNQQFLTIVILTLKMPFYALNTLTLRILQLIYSQDSLVGPQPLKGGKVDSKKPTADLTPFLSRADGWRDHTAREPKGRA